MKKPESIMQFSLRCLDQRIKVPFEISKKKLLLGSGEKCDFRVADESVSTIHAFICFKGETLKVLDLESEAGVFVNGNRVESAFVLPGDTITFGTVSFVVDFLEDAKLPVYNPDEHIQNTQLPTFTEIPTTEGLTFIDGEYCDILFDDSHFEPLTSIPHKSIEDGYVELEESASSEEIVHFVNEKRLEFITYMNGQMMDISYITPQDGQYFFSPNSNKKNEIVFNTLPRLKIFTIKKKNLTFHKNDLITLSTSWESINLNEPVFFTHGTEQVSLRLVDQTSRWKALPAFYRDRESLKQSSKIFVGMFLPILLLLMVSLPEKEVEKEAEVAVIYKIPEKAVDPEVAQEKSEVKAEVLTSETENTGHKETEQPKQKVEFAAASQNKKVVAKAAAPTPAQSAPVKTTPVKAYEFKSSVALNSLVGDAPKLNTNGSTSKSLVVDASFNAGSSDTGSLVAGADIGVSKFNGSDKKGSGSASYGSRGLAAKSGFDSSYLEPKTVVLGSMDAELLRKILREYIPQFRHCYQQELIGTSEKIKGIIDLNFTISAQGKVSKHDIRAKDARFSKKGIGCMGQVLSIIDFPKPKGGGVVDVKQPLNFFAEANKI
jgi:hypothetical protein